MPRKNVPDLITDQEMAFARLVIGGTMNDREAAQAAGINPDTAFHTKAKPCVREYMLQHRAAVERHRVAQQAEEERQLNLRRERFLGRLWQIADTGPEVTRGSFTNQLKALAMIGAMDGFIPERRPSPKRAERESTPPPVNAQIYQAEWLREQKEKAIDPQPGPENPRQEEESGLAEPTPEPIPAGAITDPISSEGTSWVPDAFLPPDAPDTKVPFWKQPNRFGRRR